MAERRLAVYHFTIANRFSNERIQSEIGESRKSIVFPPESAERTIYEMLLLSVRYLWR